MPGCLTSTTFAGWRRLFLPVHLLFLTALLGLEDSDMRLLWAHGRDSGGMNQVDPGGCIVGRAAAATALGTKNDVVARIYPGENGRWVMLESEQAYIVEGRTTGHNNLAQAQDEALRKYRFIVREKMIKQAQENAGREVRQAASKAMAEELRRGES